MASLGDYLGKYIGTISTPPQKQILNPSDLVNITSEAGKSLITNPNTGNNWADALLQIQNAIKSNPQAFSSILEATKPKANTFPQTVSTTYNPQTTTQTPTPLPPLSTSTSTIDYNTADDDTLLAELESLLSGSTSMSPDYSNVPAIAGRPNLVGDLDTLKKAFEDYQTDPEVQRLTGELEGVGRALATNTANRVPVLNQLEDQLAQRYGNYQNLIKQRADAITNALSARTDAIAETSGSKYGDYMTTEGTISPTALQGADMRAREKISSAQALTDTVSALLGKPKEQVAQGLQAFEDQLTAQTQLQNTLQALLGRKDTQFNTLASILGQYPQLRQQEFANESAQRTEAINEANAKADREFSQATNKLSLAQALNEYKNTSEGGALDNFLRGSFLNYDNAIASSFAEAPQIITKDSVAKVDVSGLDQTGKDLVNQAKTLLGDREYFALSPEEKTKLTTIESSLRQKGKSLAVPYYDYTDYISKLTNYGMSQGLKKEDLSKISSELLSYVGNIQKSQTTEQKTLDTERNAIDTAIYEVSNPYLSTFSSTSVPSAQKIYNQYTQEATKKDGGLDQIFKEKPIAFNQQVKIYFNPDTTSPSFKKFQEVLSQYNNADDATIRNRFKAESDEKLLDPVSSGGAVRYETRDINGVKTTIPYIVWDMQTINTPKEYNEMIQFNTAMKLYQDILKGEKTLK